MLGAPIPIPVLELVEFNNNIPPEWFKLKSLWKRGNGGDQILNY